MLGHRVLRTICWALTLENIAEVAGFVMAVILWWRLDAAVFAAARQAAAS